ncbi:hypothetical protein AXG93_1162s1110 [Marchantia polymorpha subsp. ruderalis]|uniref:Uncharacterized protein n=1 Tax=Marchantia polymorpha subsp. ruderalis TaxID=1480154 RepID=A0A176WRT7_MARPO|nr:hypothetical protein AXG93_1162s1110 [Marchantia polymorpha subsp. ruderalis]
MEDERRGTRRAHGVMGRPKAPTGRLSDYVEFVMRRAVERRSSVPLSDSGEPVSWVGVAISVILEAED